MRRGEQEIKTDLLTKLDSNEEKVDKIYDQARKESGIDDVVFEPSGANKNILQSQIKEIIASSVRRIENGEDAESIINQAEDKMSKLKLSRPSIEKAINKIFDFFDYDKKEVSNDIIMKEADDIVPLPRLDIDYDELKNLNLKEEEEDLLPSIERPLVTEKNRARAEKYSSMTDDEKKQFESKILNTEGKLVAETSKLEDFIRQVKLCVLTLPPSISKLRIRRFFNKISSKNTRKI